MIETKSTGGLFTVAIVSSIIAGAIGFGVAVLVNQSKNKEMEATLAELRNDIVRIERTSLRQKEWSDSETADLEEEIKRQKEQVRSLALKAEQAKAEKEKAQQEYEATQTIETKKQKTMESDEKVIWTELGFHKFYNISPKGKVEETAIDAVGDYGKPRGVKIIQVLGPYEMIVEYYTMHGGPGWASSAEQLIRLKGYSTRGLVDGDSWTARKWMGELSKVVYESTGTQRITPEIAIIGTWTYTTAVGTQKTIFTAVPLDFIRHGLTKSQFESLLK